MDETELGHELARKSALGVALAASKCGLDNLADSIRRALLADGKTHFRSHVTVVLLKNRDELKRTASAFGEARKDLEHLLSHSALPGFTIRDKAEMQFILDELRLKSREEAKQLMSDVLCV